MALVPSATSSPLCSYSLASCPSIPHVKALCLLAACMHACDYERKFQIFVADSIFFFFTMGLSSNSIVFFPLWTFFYVVLHAFRRCWFVRFLFFVLLWDRGGREILRQGNSLTEFLILAPISRLWGNFEAVLCFCRSRTITQVHPLLLLLLLLQLVPKYDDVFLLLLFRSLAIFLQHWSPLLTSIACDS